MRNIHTSSHSLYVDVLVVGVGSAGLGVEPAVVYDMHHLLMLFLLLLVVVEVMVYWVMVYWVMVYWVMVVEVEEDLCLDPFGSFPMCC